MKSRKWVISLVLILLVVTFMVFYTWPLLQINDQFHGLLERRLAAVLGDEAQLQAVQVGWGSIWLMGLDFPLTSTVHLSIDSVRVTVNPVKYATSGLRLRELIRAVHAYGTKIEVKPFAESETHDSLSGHLSSLNPSTINHYLAPWSDGFMLGWERGSVLLINDGDTLDLVPQFRGVMRGEGGAISANILGRSLSDNDNLSIMGVFNTDSSLVRGRINLDHATLSDTFLIPGSVAFGLRPSDLSIAAEFLWDSTGMHIDGNGSAADIRVPVDTFFVADFPSPKFSISNTNLTLKQGTIELPGLDITYSGEIRSITDPKLDLSLEIPSTSAKVISTFLPSISPDDVDGDFHGTVRILGSTDSLRFESSLESSLLAWRQWESRDVRVECRGQPRFFTAEIAIGDMLESRVNVTSLVDLRSPTPAVRSKFKVTGGFLRQWLHDAPELAVTGDGVWSTQSSNWKGRISRGDQPPALWNIALLDSAIHVELAQGEDYSIVSDIFELSPIPRFRLEGEGLNVLARELLARKILPGDLDLSIAASGNTDALDYDVRLLDHRQPWVVESRGKLNRQPYPAQINGDLTLTGFTFMPTTGGEYRMELARKSLYIRSLSLEDYLKADGEVDLSPMAIHDFAISINRMNIGEIAARVPLLQKRGIGGIFNAEFQGQESDSGLAWVGNVQWFDGAIGGLKGFWGNMTVQGDASKIQIKQYQIGHDIELLTYAEGSIDLSARTLSISASSKTKSLDMFAAAFTGKVTDAITGSADINARISGSLSNPEVNMSISLTNGRIFDIPYRSVEIFAADLFRDYEDGALTVDSLKVMVEPNFKILGHGNIPLKSNGQFDFDISGSGNILATLHKLTSWFREADGTGKLAAHLAGGLKNPHVDSGTLLISDGKMVMDGLFQKVDNFRLDLQIQPDGFVSVPDLEFRTRGTIMRWRNYPNLRIGSGDLEPIRIDALGLNLGIWVLDNVSGPVQVNIPGFMEHSWEGNLELAGRVEGEKFLVAEAANSLQIRGTVTVSNTTLTFPFVGTEGEASSPIVDAIVRTLENAAWDLNVIIGSDVHYYREITSTEAVPIIGPISTIFNRITADVTVDPKSKGLLVEKPDSTEKGFIVVLEGDVESTQGTVRFLDLDFQVEQAELDFDRFDPRPWVSARAKTTVNDSLGFPRTIYLTFYTVDSLSQERIRRGRWGDFTLVLEDDQGQTQEEILNMMGYSLANISGKVTTLSGTIIGDLVNGVIIRPVVEAIKKWTGVDQMEIKPHFVQNVLESEIRRNRGADTLAANFGVKYFGGSQISVGKFLTRDLFVSYSGQLASEIQGIEGGRLGLIHEWDLEYRMMPLSPYLVLDLSYQYDNLVRQSDQGILLRYSFILP
jgi:hypothetical protein